jgi:hypothetical protein
VDFLFGTSIVPDRKKQREAPVEFLFVQFNPNDRRDVLSSDNPIGRTDTELMLEAGIYHISLAGGHYHPPFWEGPIAGTEENKPMRLVFMRGA